MTKTRTAIGLMSGTSMDGIDVALLRTDGDAVIEQGPSFGVPYDASFRSSLKRALELAKPLRDRKQRPEELAQIERELTLLHAEAVKQFLKDKDIDASEVDVIGFHGQTVLHRPNEGLTIQIGDGPLLAKETGIDVVYDMRANDMAHGGQGAPLVPVYHSGLARSLEDAELPICFVNIGGISNLTYCGQDGTMIAFDSGPGNNLIDQWVEMHTDMFYDDCGMIGCKGGVKHDLVQEYLSHPFFSGNQRRSLDRHDFAPPEKQSLEIADGARTLAHVAAASILKSASYLPQPPRLYVICGGGRHNRMIMHDLCELADRQGADTVTADDLGLNGDAMEAEAWAYLAVRSLEGLPLTFPSTTGVKEPVSGGVLAKA
ncbi:anhydro-N-acetylmuramic acid kinase [Oryzifoliimicrobium ureilyticus]|uniref:anhydro-N-acetylmuramic acid kinase n=1 Tax=Oryzifoliimicrobium ureilyticus TaxID=3113724 RepID=UPI00307622BD